MNDLLAGRRVLVVEDEILLVMMIEDMLGDLGCTSVFTATTVARALALIDGQTFDAAMLDMNLGGMGTQSVADALAAHDVPFIYSTGNSTRDILAGYRDRPVLRKPFSFEELAESLSALLTADGPGPTGQA